MLSIDLDTLMKHQISCIAPFSWAHGLGFPAQLRNTYTEMYTIMYQLSLNLVPLGWTYRISEDLFSPPYIICVQTSAYPFPCYLP